MHESMNFKYYSSFSIRLSGLAKTCKLKKSNAVNRGTFTICVFVHSLDKTAADLADDLERPID